VFFACAGGVDRTHGNIHVKVYMGPGYYCYCVCLFGAMMRAIFHWVTPLPGRGSGCKPRLPRSLLKKLDLHHDSQVSWNELRDAYRHFVKRHHEERRHRKEEKLALKQQPVLEAQPTATSDPISLDGGDVEVGNSTAAVNTSTVNQIQEAVPVPAASLDKSKSTVPAAAATAPMKSTSSSSLRGQSVDREPQEVENLFKQRKKTEKGLKI
jgi:hypothetical protein